MPDLAVAVPVSGNDSVDPKPPYNQITEELMHEWLRENGYPDAEHEGEDNIIVLLYWEHERRERRSWTVPDFTLPEHGVHVEITCCRWSKHRSRLQESVHRRQLKLKRARARRIREIGYGYVLIEGDLLGEILKGKPDAIKKFHWEVRREARRARDHVDQVREHNEGVRRRNKRQKPLSARRYRRSLRSQGITPAPERV